MSPADKTHRTLAASALVLFLVLSASGPSRLSACGGLPTLTIVRVAAPPVIDGRLDDAVWAEALRF